MLFVSAIKRADANAAETKDARAIGIMRSRVFYSVAVPRSGGAQAPQIVARPPNLAVLLTYCGQLILGKIRKFDVTRCQILRQKCTKFYFRRGSAPHPAEGANSAPPDPLAVLKGAYF